MKIQGLLCKRVWYVRVSRENLLEILAVVIVLSLISCVRGATPGA